MTVKLNNDGTLAITAMSFVEFLPEIESAIHNGYMLDLDKNEGVPQSYGHMLVLTMYPVGEVEVSEIEDAPLEVSKVDESASKEVSEIHTVVHQSQDTVAAVKVDGRRKK